MKIFYSISTLLLFSVALLMLLVPRTSYAQVSDTGDFLRALQSGTLSDVELMLGEYTRPYAEGLGAVSNTGWVKTAGSHGVLGFDLSISLGIAAVPGSKDSFDLSALGLTNIEASGLNTVTPTISGSDNQGIDVSVFADVPGFNERQEVANFSLPSGTGFGYTPAPMLQLGIGVPKNTDIILRYVPEVGLGDYGDFAIFGLGVKHELNQWIPGYLPVDLSVMAGFTNIDLSGSFTLAASDIEFDDDPNDLNRPSVWEGQQANMSSSAWNANVLAGKNIGPLGVYGGLGLQSSSFELAFDGRFPFIEVETRVENGEPEVVRVLSSIEDPIKVDVESSTIVRAMAGVSLKLTFFRLNADITYAEYAVLNAGVGFTFR